MNEYEITHWSDGSPSICVPKGLDMTNFQNVSCLGDDWAVFLDMATGEIHDCSVYFAQFCDEQDCD